MLNTDNDGYINVAVYGSLKRGFGNHRLLADARFMSHGIIKNSILVSLGAFPALYINQLSGDNVQVEVYRVTPEEFQSLDMLEGYPSFYNRSMFDIVINTDNHEPLTIKSWIYHFNGDYANKYPRVHSINGIANWTLTSRQSEFSYYD